MRRLIADIYKIMYKITSNKLISLSFALTYITVLNLLTIYGVCLLLGDLVPYIEMVAVICRRPYIYGTAIVVLALNFWMMLPLQNLSKERAKGYALTPIIIYTFVSILLFVYARYVVGAF